MADALDDEWIAALDRRLRGDAEVTRAAEHAALTVEHVVRAPDGTERAMHLTAHDGTVRALSGPAPPDTDGLVRFVTGRDAADAVRTGSKGTRAAVLSGDIEVDGDVAALVAHRALIGVLDAVTAGLRVT